MTNYGNYVNFGQYLPKQTGLPSPTPTRALEAPPAIHAKDLTNERVNYALYSTLDRVNYIAFASLGDDPHGLQATMESHQATDITAVEEYVSPPEQEFTEPVTSRPLPQPPPEEMAAKSPTIPRREPPKAPINRGIRGPLPFDPAYPPKQAQKQEQIPQTTSRPLPIPPKGYPVAKPNSTKIPTEAPQVTKTPPMERMEQPPAPTGYPAAKPTPPKIPTEAPQASTQQEQARTESPRKATIPSSEAHREIAKSFKDDVAQMDREQVMTILRDLGSGEYGKGWPNSLKSEIAQLCNERLNSLPRPIVNPLEGLDTDTLLLHIEQIQPGNTHETTVNQYRQEISKRLAMKKATMAEETSTKGRIKRLSYAVLHGGVIKRLEQAASKIGVKIDQPEEQAQPPVRARTSTSVNRKSTSSKKLNSLTINRLKELSNAEFNSEVKQAMDRSTLTAMDKECYLAEIVRRSNVAATQKGKKDESAMASNPELRELSGLMTDLLKYKGTLAQKTQKEQLDSTFEEATKQINKHLENLPDDQKKAAKPDQFQTVLKEARSEGDENPRVAEELRKAGKTFDTFATTKPLLKQRKELIEAEKGLREAGHDTTAFQKLIETVQGLIDEIDKLHANKLSEAYEPKLSSGLEKLNEVKLKDLPQTSAPAMTSWTVENAKVKSEEGKDANDPQFDLLNGHQGEEFNNFKAHAAGKQSLTEDDFSGDGARLFSFGEVKASAVVDADRNDVNSAKATAKVLEIIENRLSNLPTPPTPETLKTIFMDIMQEAHLSCKEIGRQCPMTLTLYLPMENGNTMAVGFSMGDTFNFVKRADGKIEILTPSPEGKGETDNGGGAGNILLEGEDRLFDCFAIELQKGDTLVSASDFARDNFGFIEENLEAGKETWQAFYDAREPPKELVEKQTKIYEEAKARYDETTRKCNSLSAEIKLLPKESPEREIKSRELTELRKSEKALREETIALHELIKHPFHEKTGKQHKVDDMTCVEFTAP